MCFNAKGGRKSPAPPPMECPNCYGKGQIFIGLTTDKERCPVCRGEGTVPDDRWPGWVSVLIIVLVIYTALRLMGCGS